jgi:hypothetical protein
MRFSRQLKQMSMGSDPNDAGSRLKEAVDQATKKNLLGGQMKNSTLGWLMLGGMIAGWTGCKMFDFYRILIIFFFSTFFFAFDILLCIFYSHLNFR